MNESDMEFTRRLRRLEVACDAGDGREFFYEAGKREGAKARLHSDSSKFRFRSAIATGLLTAILIGPASYLTGRTFAVSESAAQTVKVEKHGDTQKQTIPKLPTVPATPTVAVLDEPVPNQASRTVDSGNRAEPVKSKAWARWRFPIESIVKPRRSLGETLTRNHAALMMEDEQSTDWTLASDRKALMRLREPIEFEADRQRTLVVGDAMNYAISSQGTR